MSKYTPDPRLVFLDLETTGLDPTRDSILEIGIVVVDPMTLEPLSSWTTCLVPEGHPNGVSAVTLLRDKFVLDMHIKSGLIAALDRGIVPRTNHAQAVACDFMLDNGFEFGKATIAGYCPQFDLSFLKVHMPVFANWFDYRVVDVSTIRGLARRWVGPEVDVWAKREAGGETKHRAIEDCHEARKELQRYARHLFDVDGFRKLMPTAEETR